jgi:hypothetical protein
VGYHHSPGFQLRDESLLAKYSKRVLELRATARTAPWIFGVQDYPEDFYESWLCSRYWDQFIEEKTRKRCAAQTGPLQ